MDKNLASLKKKKEDQMSINTCIDNMLAEEAPCPSCTSSSPGQPSVGVSQGDWRTLREEPGYMLSFVDKYVTVYLPNNKTCSGFLHCYDGGSFSVVLLVNKHDAYHPIIIPGDTVRNITVTPTPAHLDPPPRMSPVSSDQEDEDQLAAKAVVIAWYPPNQNHPEDDKLSIATDELPSNCVAEMYTGNIDDLMRSRHSKKESPEDSKPSSSEE